MKIYSKVPLLMASLIILGALGLFAGCSDDDPTAPATLPESGYLAVTPDSLMSLWQTGLATMDSTMYGDVLHPDFRFQFSASDLSNFQLLTDHMTHDETVQTAWNMFAGESVTNWQGNVVPGVSRISFPYLIQQTPWEIVAAGSANESASARFMMQMFVDRGFHTILAATGLYDFVALKVDTTNADGSDAHYFRLIRMTGIDPTTKSSEVNTWGGVHLTYLVNEPPEAALLVTDMGGSPLPLLQCDASGSRDLDSGLHPEGYRWQFETGGSWTTWSGDSVTVKDFQIVGSQNKITVEVRDRWGARATASREFIVPGPDLPFPSSPDILMNNFQTIYETRYFEGYRELIHLDFLTILQESTTTEFPDLGTTLDANEDLRIHQRMFSGDHVTDPNGDFVPGVQEIVFHGFRALDTWIQSPPDDIIPNALWAPFEVDILFDRGQNFSYLKVEGTIKFYVTSRDSLHNGQVQPYYMMAGQVDLTNLGKAVEGLSWGSVKALFR